MAEGEAAPDPHRPCRCGHPSSSHSFGGGLCNHYIGPTYCQCKGFDDEEPLTAASRAESWHEILEKVVEQDRKYAAMQEPPWSVGNS